MVSTVGTKKYDCDQLVVKTSFQKLQIILIEHKTNIMMMK